MNHPALKIGDKYLSEPMRDVCKANKLKHLAFMINAHLEDIKTMKRFMQLMNTWNRVERARLEINKRRGWTI